MAEIVIDNDHDDRLKTSTTITFLNANILILFEIEFANKNWNVFNVRIIFIRNMYIK